jgi:transcriptional regulator with XRE-family HTH domain
MTQIRVRLPELMAQHRINRKQLAEETGMRYATLSDVYTGKSRPSLETLEVVIGGLERMTGKPVELTDLLEVVRQQLPLHGDPNRAAFDHTNLKSFSLRERGARPKVATPTEVLVAEIRGRA